MSTFARTSISLPPDTLKAGQARAKSLGYDSFSDYLAFLIKRDAAERPTHTTTRGEEGTQYSSIPTGTTERTIEIAGQPVRIIAPTVFTFGVTPPTPLKVAEDPPQEDTPPAKTA